MKLPLLTAALVSAAITLAAPVAQADSSTRAYRITLAFAAGDTAETVYTRLSKAASRACEVDPALDGKALRQRKKCARDIIAAALDVMNRPDVAALHASRG